MTINFGSTGRRVPLPPPPTSTTSTTTGRVTISNSARLSTVFDPKFLFSVANTAGSSATSTVSVQRNTLARLATNPTTIRSQLEKATEDVRRSPLDGVISPINDRLVTNPVNITLAASIPRLLARRTFLTSPAIDSAVDQTTIFDPSSLTDSPERSNQSRFILAEAFSDPRAFRARQTGTPTEIAEELESYHGPESLRLTAAENPKIIYMVDEEIDKFGAPSKVTLVVKKITTDRVRVINYSIFRKDVFKDVSYTKVADGPFNLGSSYLGYADSVGLDRKDCFSFSDDYPEPGGMYAYKIHVEYDANMEAQERADALAESVAERVEPAATRPQNDLRDDVIQAEMGLTNPALRRSLF